MIIYGAMAFIVVWLATLSFFLYKTRRHYLTLVTHTKKHTIEGILDQLVADDTHLTDKIDTIGKELSRVAAEQTGHFQKVGVVRFNPFGRSGGGEQSFVLALLDKKNSGIVLNFISTHEGLRVYTKEVAEGAGRGVQLSEEEKKAIATST